MHGPINKHYLYTISWNTICMPNIKGGLGITSIEDQKAAYLLHQCWSSVTNRESSQKNWASPKYLQHHSFWEAPCNAIASWVWRSIIELRDLVHAQIFLLIGDGKPTNFGTYPWLAFESLTDQIGIRNVVYSGFNLK